MDYYQKHLRMTAIMKRLGDKVISGKANLYEHRAWLRGWYFHQYITDKMFNSTRDVAAWDGYLQTSATWFCPQCFMPVEPKNIWHVHGLGDRCTSCVEHLIVDRFEAEDNQPARQKGDIQ